MEWERAEKVNRKYEIRGESMEKAGPGTDRSLEQG